MSDDPKRQEALEAARSTILTVRAGPGYERRCDTAIADLLLAWDARAERRGRAAELRRAGKFYYDFAMMVLSVDQGKSDAMRFRSEQSYREANALEAEGKE